MAGVRKSAALLVPPFKPSPQNPLQESGRRYSLEQQPLWAQDFFSVVDRKSILSPYELIII